MNEWQRLFRQWKNQVKDWFQDRSQTQRRRGRPDIKMCPACGNFVGAKAITCEYCRAELAPKPQATVNLDGRPKALPLNPIMIVFAICIFMQLVSIALSTKMPDYSLTKELWSPHIGVLRGMGANDANWTLGQWELWRVATYIFLHGGFFHIFFNLMALAQLGPLTLHHFGKRRFWLLTLLTGMCGGLFSALYGSFSVKLGLAPYTLPSVGISGSLFGFLAVNYVHFHLYGPSQMAYVFKKYLIWGNAICIGLTLLKIMPVDNAAHIGGMTMGLVLGVLFTKFPVRGLTPLIERLVLTACLLFFGYGLWRSFFYLHGYFWS